MIRIKKDPTVIRKQYQEGLWGYVLPAALVGTLFVLALSGFGDVQGQLPMLPDALNWLCWMLMLVAAIDLAVQGFVGLLSLRMVALAYGVVVPAGLAHIVGLSFIANYPAWAVWVWAIILSAALLVLLYLLDVAYGAYLDRVRATEQRS